MKIDTKLVHFKKTNGNAMNKCLKDRVQVSFDQETLSILKDLSEKRQKPMSCIVRQIVEDWMQKYEDQYWIEVATREDVSRTLSHKEVWNES